MAYQTTRPNMLAAPAVLWLLAFMVAPCLLVLSYAFFQRGTWGGIEYSFTLENFARTGATLAIHLSVQVLDEVVARLVPDRADGAD